jgi:hypothetical protein
VASARLYGFKGKSRYAAVRFLLDLVEQGRSLHLTGSSARVVAKMARPSFIARSDVAAEWAGEGHWLYSPFAAKPGDTSKPTQRVCDALPFLLIGEDPWVIQWETRATGSVEVGRICKYARFGSQADAVLLVVFGIKQRHTVMVAEEGRVHR